MAGGSNPREKTERVEEACKRQYQDSDVAGRYCGAKLCAFGEGPLGKSIALNFVGFNKPAENTAPANPILGPVQ